MLETVQKALVEILYSDDPIAAREEVLQQADLSEEDRDCLEQLNEEGLRLVSIIVRKLRFERLTEGELSLGQFFDDDPRAFLTMYRAYTQEVPPVSYFPGQEAEWYHRWRERTDQN